MYGARELSLQSIKKVSNLIQKIRGICAMNTLKLLCLIMNERIDNYLQNNKIINEEQIGFQRGNRTTDHILTLKVL